MIDETKLRELIVYWRMKADRQRVYHRISEAGTLDDCADALEDLLPETPE